MNFIEITDINAPELDVFSRITEPQLRTYFEPEIGIFLAETANVIMRAIEAGYEPLSMLVEKERLEAEAGPVFECIEKYCGKEKLISMPVYIAARDIVTQLTGYTLVRGLWMTGYTLVRGLWMTLRRRPEMSVEEFCKDKKRITVLMDVVNPTNVGAIIRSAAALGMDGVLLTHASVDPLTRRSARVSMGTCFQIPWTKATLEQSEGLNLLDILHSYGFKTVAMALTEEANDKLAVLMGSEGPGLPKEVIATSDYRVMIPMYHGVDSLNVAAASAVAFWELTK